MEDAEFDAVTERLISEAMDAGIFPDRAAIPCGVITIAVYIDGDGEKTWSYRLAGMTATDAVGYLTTLSTAMAVDAMGVDS